MQEFVSTIEKTSAYNVLFVEDDGELREVIGTILEEFFQNVYLAKDGEDALEVFKNNHCDIVITDIHMPKMNGFKLIENMRLINKDVHVLVFTGEDDIHVLTEGFNLSVDDYLFKPFDILQFTKVMDKVINEMLEEKENKNTLHILKQYQEVTNVGSIVSKTDPKGRITYVNERFCSISGYSKEELLGKSHSIVRHPEMPKEVYAELWNTIKNEKKIWQGIVKNLAKNGESYYVKATIMPIFDKSGEICEYISIRQDISDIMSDRKQLFDYLNANKLSVIVMIKIEDYDVLEKLYSPKIVEQIEDEFAKAILYFMPNNCNFQRVYELGNGLYALARDRRSCQSSWETITKRLEKFLKNIRSYVVRFDDIEYDISAICSFTYGVFRIYEDAKLGIEKAIDEKLSIVYADGLSEWSYSLARQNIQVLKTVKTAIDGKQVVSYFQPIVDNKTKKVSKYESLVRIIDEEGKILSPFYFLDLSKKGRYYKQITKIVLLNSFEALAQTDKEISINLSTLDIEHSEVRTFIITLLNDNIDDANRVVFELLESEEVKDLGIVKNFIKIVKGMGVKIAIDDFGSGYSNFERLFEYEPDILKIDGQLIKNIVQKSLSRNIVETMVAFAKKQNVKTVAEFVENEELFSEVCKVGIDYSQGYFFGAPALLEE